MSPNTAAAIAYLLAEALATGLKLSDILATADEVGALPPEKMAEIKAGLRADFAEAREFWGEG